MRTFIHSFIVFALLTGCEATSQVAKAPPTEAQVLAAKPGEPLSPLKADGTLKPPFPPGFLARLNAIMVRCKKVIDRFDEMRPAIEKAGQASAAELAELTSMHKESRSAIADLSKEGKLLIETGQYYDTAIFSGMALFARKVEGELSEEVKLRSAPKK